MGIVKLAVSGALGRMGVRVREAAAADPRFEIVQLLETEGHPESGRPVPAVPGGPALPVASALAAGADVLVDFTTPEGFRQRLVECVGTKTAFVSGTTGLGRTEADLLVDASSEIPVFHATNLSLGVEAIRRAACGIAAWLPEDFDIEVTEVHHRRKVDAPSGTALTLFRSLAEVRGMAADAPTAGRCGAVGPRRRGEIGVHAVRGGDVVGEHTVLFLGTGERVEVTHRCTDRGVFARGALEASAWIASAAPGRYGIRDLHAGPRSPGENQKSS